MASKIKKGKTKKSNKVVKKAKPTKMKKIISKTINTKVIKKSKNSATSSGVKVKAKAKVVSSKSKTRPQSKLKLKAIHASTPKKKSKTVAVKLSKAKQIKKTSEKSSQKPVKNFTNKKSSSQFSCALPSFQDTSGHMSTENLISPEHLLSGPANKFEPYHIESTEEYMNEQQLEHFTNILEAWKQDLMLEVDHTITEMKEADVLADPNDRATQEETFNLELRARDRERKLIKKIETALKKIKDNEYGYCESCGVEIGVRRLEARPTATLCIECKTLAEIREKRV